MLAKNKTREAIENDSVGVGGRGVARSTPPKNFEPCSSCGEGWGGAQTLLATPLVGGEWDEFCNSSRTLAE